MTARALRNHKYKARVSVPWYERPAVNEGVIMSKLLDAGFDRINVQKTGAGEYKVEAVWLHPDSDAVDVPSELKDIEDEGVI